MLALTCRDLIQLGLGILGRLALGVVPQTNTGPAGVHEQLLDLAARQEERRRTRFAAVKIESRPGGSFRKSCSRRSSGARRLPGTARGTSGPDRGHD